MNTTPRWSCRLARASLSLFGDSAHRRGPGSSHIAHCADCQRFLAAAEAVTARLRADAARAYQFPSAGFDQRVLRAIVPTAPAPTPRLRPRAVAVLTLASAAAALALTITVTRIRTTPVDRTPPVVAAPNAGPTSTAVIATPDLSADPELLATAETPDDGTASLLERNPLQSEAESVYADARGAMRFLALNFLPADAVARIDGARPRPRNDG